nr:MAG TPA: hypothetical protein [Caudoviricetes sp.]
MFQDSTPLNNRHISYYTSRLSPSSVSPMVFELNFFLPFLYII